MSPILHRLFVRSASLTASFVLVGTLEEDKELRPEELVVVE